MKFIEVGNAPYCQIVARIIVKGDKYGRGGCQTHGFDTPLIEFYDARYGKGFVGEEWHEGPDGFVGQFISRYYIETLINGQHEQHGLNLDGGIPDWSLTPETCAKVLSWAQNVTGVRRRA